MALRRITSAFAAGAVAVFTLASCAGAPDPVASTPTGPTWVEDAEEFISFSFSLDGQEHTLTVDPYEHGGLRICDWDGNMFLGNGGGLDPGILMLMLDEPSNSFIAGRVGTDGYAAYLTTYDSVKVVTRESESQISAEVEGTASVVERDAYSTAPVDEALNSGETVDVPATLSFLITCEGAPKRESD